MSVSAPISRSVGVGGKTFAEQLTASDEADLVREVSVPAAKAGSLTTRTDANTGTLTMSAGHGIATGARLDIYWAGGSRRGVVAGTVSVNSVPIDLGAGDDLPSASTVIAAMVPVSNEFLVTGNNASLVAFKAPKRATFVLAESDDTEILGRVVQASRIYLWDEGSGDVNPLAGGDIAKLFLSHGETTSVTLLVGILFD